MAKRKQPDLEPKEPAADTPSKRRRRTTDREEILTNGTHEDEPSPPVLNGTPSKQDTPSRRTRRSVADALEQEEQDEGSPTPKVNGRTLFATPSKGKDKVVTVTPSRSVKAKADRSARRKSTRLLAEAQNEEGDEDEFEGQDTRLAREILDEEEEQDEDEAGEADLDDDESPTPSKTTPSKRGRPKTRTRSAPQRTPTPEGVNIAPEERYFFQTRSVAPQISSNRFNTVKALTHDEYVERISSWSNPHEAEERYLLRLHARSFPQWRFELEEGFGLCLYGFGSKRGLVGKFAEWLYENERPEAPRIVVVNGYTPKLNMRNVLNTIATAIAGDEGDTTKLTGQPEEMLDTLLSHLTDTAPPTKVHIFINSIDALPLRRPTTQSLLSRLSAHPCVHFLCTADTPTFPTLWNSSLLSNFRFLHHDCTTFAPYEVEIGSVVDEVHDLIGRKRTRGGGKEGVAFVLRSLPENARSLYRLLLEEILGLMQDGADGTAGIEDEDEDDEDDEGHLRTPKKPKSRATDLTADEVCVEYRALYRKASEGFICSSSMNFQSLLKEFLDHQMISSRRDATSGAEMLGIPLGRAEMEGVLEELA